MPKSSLSPSSCNAGASVFAQVRENVKEVYDIISGIRLGSGVFGKVVLGVKKGSNGNVRHALKFVDPEYYSEWEREVTSLSKLRHENVLELLGVFTCNKNIVLASPLADLDLRDYLKRRGKLGDSVAMEVASQIVCGMRHVHQVGVIHRDLKPANIFIQIGYASASIVKVGDFGQACVFNVDEEPRTAVVQTVNYRAPELIFVSHGGRRESYGTAIDVWSFGAILYEMLCGNFLARGVEPQQIVRDLLKHVGPLPQVFPYTTYPPGLIPQDVVVDPAWPRRPSWDVVRACLHYSPIGRATFASVADNCRVPEVVEDSVEPLPASSSALLRGNSLQSQHEAQFTANAESTTSNAAEIPMRKSQRWRGGLLDADPAATNQVTQRAPKFLIFSRPWGHFVTLDISIRPHGGPIWPHEVRIEVFCMRLLVSIAYLLSSCN